MSCRVHWSILPLLPLTLPRSGHKVRIYSSATARPLVAYIRRANRQTYLFWNLNSIVCWQSGRPLQSMGGSKEDDDDVRAEAKGAGGDVAASK
jgi:hypothetical protein